MKAKAYFEAIGRSDESRGLSLLAGRAQRLFWPQWAREAYARGRFRQGPWGAEGKSRE